MSPRMSVVSKVRPRGNRRTLRGRLLRRDVPPPPTRLDRIKQAGQVIVLFALMLVALIGLVGVAIDVTWAWRNALLAQRAADAAALAGAVYLPGAVDTGRTAAYQEATKNGYTTGGKTVVTADPAPANANEMDVSVTTPVPTFFVRIFGINEFMVTRSARGTYTLPVPMGSPLYYYGVGCFVLKGQTSLPDCTSNGTGASGIVNPANNSIDSLGAWGAVITKGGNAENGDAYSPQFNRNYTNPNPKYDADGYYYTVSLPSGGSVYLFDPGFCEMGDNGAGSYWGTGDHWIAQDDNSSNYSAVSTYYSLYDTHGVPMEPSLWGPPVATSGTTFQDQKGKDASGSGGTHGAGSCDSYHNTWYKFATGLAAGTYELQVSTTSKSNSSKNLHANAENMFAVMAYGGGGPAVYGRDHMAVYNNLMSGSGVPQKFYLAKVDQATGAGKTLQIDLFDIGDSSAGSLQILAPDGSGGKQRVANFSYTTSPECKAGKSDACSDTSGTRTTITVAVAGVGSSFNSTWLHITIALPTSYGSGGLWQGGWWQISYNTVKGNDTTTWAVNVKGNPVHLLP